MPVTSELSSTYWRGTKGYRLHCSENVLQLYDQHRGNTFIFLTRPPEKSGSDIVASVALQKISGRVQKVRLIHAVVFHCGTDFDSNVDAYTGRRW